MNSKLLIAAAAVLPIVLAFGGCTREETTTATGKKTTTTVTVDLPPAVEKRTEQMGAVLDDAGITAKVKTALIAEPGLSGLAIDVDTSANIVSLHGSVASDAARANAERVAKSVSGVKDVKNNLTVKQAG
jgi:osmotically-inducible protein OsmY